MTYEKGLLRAAEIADEYADKNLFGDELTGAIAVINAIRAEASQPDDARAAFSERYLSSPDDARARSIVDGFNKASQPEGVVVPDKMPDEFLAWIQREIPSGTVISNPAWWAPKIYRAMLRAAGEQK